MFKIKALISILFTNLLITVTVRIDFDDTLINFII